LFVVQLAIFSIGTVWSHSLGCISNQRH
jgi:hypothetical protein